MPNELGTPRDLLAPHDLSRRVLVASDQGNTVTHPPTWYLEWPCYGDMDCHCSPECSAKIEKQERALAVEGKKVKGKTK